MSIRVGVPDGGSIDEEHFFDWQSAYEFIAALPGETIYWRIRVDGKIARDELEGTSRIMWDALAEHPYALKLLCGMKVGELVERYPLEAA